MKLSIKYFLLPLLILSLLILSLTACNKENTVKEESNEEISENHNSESSDSIVYFTSDISPEGLDKTYEALEWSPTEKTAVKLSTGEPPNSNYLRPKLIQDLVKKVNGTIVECNTAYGGSRAETEMHYQVAEDHGFTQIAPFKILDENGSKSLPVNQGQNLTENKVEQILIIMILI